MPHQPPQVTKVSSTTSSLSIAWTEPANRGNEILKYSLYYREEAGTYQDLTSSIGALDTSYTITGLSVGINYEFVVNCENIYGKSQNSTSSLIKCATNPDPSTSLGTSYDDTNVIFS